MFQFVISVGIATGSQLAGRLANVAVSLLVIALVGATAQTDRFFFILAVAFYFYGALANAVTQATVPLVISRTMCLKPVHVAACGGITALLTASAAALAGWAFTPIALPYIAAMGLLSGAGIANGLAAGVWQARERFVFPGLSWSLRLIPLGAWYLLDASGRTLAWLALGIGMADVLRCAIMLGRPCALDNRLAQTSPWDLKLLLSTYGAVIMAAAIGGLNPIIDRIIANLGPAGSISIIETGERVYMMLAGLATIGVVTVLLPRLSRAVQDGTLKQIWPEVIRFIGFWSAAWLVAGWLVGRYGFRWWLTAATGLSAQATEAAQWVYWYYLMGLPFFSLALVYVKRLQALRHWRIMVGTAAISVALNIPASLILLQLLGVPGIALATTGIHVINCAVLIWAAHAVREPEPSSV